MQDWCHTNNILQVHNKKTNKEIIIILAVHMYYEIVTILICIRNCDVTDDVTMSANNPKL